MSKTVQVVAVVAVVVVMGLLVLTFCGSYRANPVRLSTFPEIDLVVTWVDGYDPHLRALKAKYRGESNPHHGAVVAHRQDGHDELKYLLRSVESYAPWIRKVHILVSHHQCPIWLNRNHPKIHLVNDTEIFPNADDLPTFNSHALECNLHRIPGLSEHFIYSCDDMMFGDHVSPKDFFNDDGTLALFVGGYKRNRSRAEVADSMHFVAWFNNYLLLDMSGCVNVPQTLPCHQMQILTKTLGRRMEDKYGAEVARTSSTRFRHESNIHPVGLQLYLGCHEGRVRVADNPPSQGYFPWSNKTYYNEAKLLELEVGRPKLMCVNNIRGKDVGLWKSFVERYYPGKSGFEL